MIKIICVGKLKESYLKGLVEDYLKRINKYHKTIICELKDSSINEEKEEILKHILKDEYIICLTINSKEYSSLEFSQKIDSIFISGKSNITFVIGGSTGIHEDIIKLSNEEISFSKLTFPHGLFRGILLEQLYRSFKIMNNESYHK